MAYDDPWQILGVPRNASRQEIRAAYHQLAKVWHPDRFRHEDPELQERATRELQRINDAYQQLDLHSKNSNQKSAWHPRHPSAPPGSAREAVHRKVFTIAFWIFCVLLAILALRFGLLFRSVMVSVITAIVLPFLAAVTARLTADGVLSLLGGKRDQADDS